MLSAILKSSAVVDISVKIIRTFVNMRKFIASNSLMHDRFERVEQKVSIHDEKFNKIFKAIEDKSFKPKQGIFYNGQIFDAYIFINDIIKSAKKSIILIYSYINENTLIILSKRGKIGASLKDFGKKWFAFSKMDIESFEMMGRLK